MKELQYKHFGRFLGGKPVWESPEMYQYKRMNLEGKRFYAIIEEAEDDISPNQYAYYFGGIIRRECMNSNVFAGFTDKEIHQILFAELRSKTKGKHCLDGTVQLVTVTDDFSAYKKPDMTRYIEELIPYLQLEYNIDVKPASHYKYNKFFLDTKIIK
jgi:hypothetical protein